MENLISMTDFVLQIETKQCKSDDKEDNLDLIFNYATFIKQPRELWMFVPCDKDGNVLPLPGSAPIYTHSKEYERKWREAKDRCLFEGYEYFRKWYGSDIVAKDKIIGHGKIDLSEFHTIEDLINYNLKLTPAALIQFT